MGDLLSSSQRVHVGVTKGRGKQDRDNQYLLPLKDIWVYPLDISFHNHLRT